FIIEAIALILLLLFLFAWLKLGLINWDDLKNLRINKLDDETAALLDGYTTVAFFGVDNRSAGHYEGGNSDSIMICTINNDTKEVRVASVYRDTVLDVDGNGTYKKCNYAYNHGGPEEAINMLNLNMDLDIQKYVAVDFFALAEVIDAFGGIDLDITEEEAYHMNSGGDMCYIWETATSAGVEVPPDVTPGNAVHVNGVQAVAYARIRKTSGGDFARAQRQRIVLEKVVEKAQNANIFTLNKVADAAFDDVGTNFTLNQILSLAKYVKDYQLVDTAGFPFYKNSEHRLEGTSVVCPCTLESNVRQLHAFLYNNPDVKLSDVVVSTSKDIENLMGLGEEDALDYGY
ncbi:MAG: LCP family protein, partial [Lachnospiraceae bacterium]|nr:LCP family protein [Lachnospiraceae bacterium]